MNTNHAHSKRCYPMLGLPCALLISVIIFSMVSKGAAAADPPSVRFKTHEVKAPAEPGVAVVELCYEFTNTGDFPIAVEEFIQSCGCMIGEWDGKPIAPGSSGRITAKFLTAGLRGTVRKSLQVKFLDTGTVELTGVVTIPETLTYSTQTVRWGIGDECEPRVIDIAIKTAKPVHVLSVRGDDAFTVELATVEDGRSYRVTITPRDTAAGRVGIFQVRTDAADPRHSLQALFGLIEKQPAAKGVVK